MSKSYCSSNTKYYKNSNASGELGHVNRNVFEIDENTLPIDLIKYDNFGSWDVGKALNNTIYDCYKNTLKKAEEHRGKKFQKNANTFIDSVVSLSRDRVDYLIEKKGIDWFNKATSYCIQEWQQEVKKQYGFEPIGFNFHMDEGYVQPDGSVKHNYHGHCIFFNYDFEKGTQPLRTMKKKDFSKMQDLLADKFNKMGFERGISKELTKKNHLEKDKFIEKKQEKSKEILVKIEEDTIKTEIERDNLKNEIQELKENHKSIKQRLKLFYDDLRVYIVKTLSKELKASNEAADAVLEHIIEEQDAETKQQMINYSFETDGQLKNDNLTSKIKTKTKLKI